MAHSLWVTLVQLVIAWVLCVGALAVTDALITDAWRDKPKPERAVWLESLFERLMVCAAVLTVAAGVILCMAIVATFANRSGNH